MFRPSYLPETVAFTRVVRELIRRTSYVPPYQDPTQPTALAVETGTTGSEQQDTMPPETVGSRSPAEPLAVPTETAALPAVPLNGIALGGGAVVLVPGTPTAADIADIAVAARPLLDLLAVHGLLSGREPS